MTYSSVKVTVPGDVNGDFTVDWQDLLDIAMAYLTKQGDPGYVPEVDVTCDGQIDWEDLLELALNYLKSDP